MKNLKNRFLIICFLLKMAVFSKIAVWVQQPRVIKLLKLWKRSKENNVIDIDFEIYARVGVNWCTRNYFYDSFFCVGPHHRKELRASEKLYESKCKKLFKIGLSGTSRIIHSQFSQMRQIITFIMSIWLFLFD